MQSLIGKKLNARSGDQISLTTPGSLLPLNPKEDKMWLMPDATKSECENMLSTGSPGDFVVRAKKDRSKFFICMHDIENPTVHTVNVTDGKYIFAKKRCDSIEGLIASLTGQPLKGKSGHNLFLLRAAKPLVSSNGSGKDDETFDGFGDSVKDDVLPAAASEPEPAGFEDDVFVDASPDTSDPDAVANEQAARTDQHSFFYGDVDLAEAADLVLKQDDGSFLVRKENDSLYQLLVRDSNKVATFPIRKTEVGSFQCFTVTAKSMKSLIQKTARQSLQSNVSNKMLHLAKPVPGGRRFSRSS